MEWLIWGVSSLLLLAKSVKDSVPSTPTPSVCSRAKLRNTYINKIKSNNVESSCLTKFSVKMQQGTPESFMLFLILEYLHHLVWSARQSSSEWPLHPSSPRGPGWCQPLRCGRWAPVPRGHLGAAPGTQHNRVSVNWTPLCNKAWYISTSLLNYLFFPFYILQMYQLHHFHQIHIYFYWYIILERVLHVIHLRNTLCDKILKKMCT